MLTKIKALIIFNRRAFSTKAFVFPDQILRKVKSVDSEAGNLELFEEEILQNYHFFDAQQYMDIFTLFLKNDQGSSLFWETYEAKIFDYDLCYSDWQLVSKYANGSNKISDYVNKKIFDSLVELKRMPLDVKARFKQIYHNTPATI